MRPTAPKKLVYDISASALQVIVSQLSGAVLFLLLSNYLSKPDIGIINWSLAVLSIIYAMLGFGMDAVVIRKIAMGENATTLLSTHLLHVFFFGVVFFIVMIISVQFAPFPNNSTPFVLLGLSQLFIFLSVPFKQIINGLEKFRSLLVMSVCANLLRILGLFALMFIKSVSLLSVIYLHLFSSIVELIVCVIVYSVSLRSPIRIKWNKDNYLSLVRAAFPQMGVIFFTAILARIDWILLGLLSTSIVVADYSFTYRTFELSTTPLLVLGMLLLPKIARLFADKKELDAETNSVLINFAGNEMRLAVFTMLMLQVSWAPIIDSITNGKYGTHNISLIFILSLVTPFLYLNNILWSIDFAKGNLKHIFYVFLITCIVNVVADLILIPPFNGNGAAAGFCIAIITQTILYLRRSSLSGYAFIFRELLIAVVAAALAGWVSVNYINGPIERIAVSAAIYGLLLFITKRVTLRRGSLLASLSKI